MEFLNEIEDGSILVTPNSWKLKILKEIDAHKKLHNIKIMSFDELLNLTEFSISKEALFYLTKEKKIPLSIAHIYLKNMYYIEEETDNERLQELFNLKKELFSKKLLKKDELFVKSLEKRSLYFYGYDFFLKEEQKFIQKLSSHANIQIHKKPERPPKELTVYKFQTIQEELEYVLQQICDLLTSGISLHQIKLIGVSDEYTELLTRMSKLYHVPIQISNQNSIYETEIGKAFLELLKEKTTFEEIINQLEEEETDEEIIAQLINILNQYIWFDGDIKDLEEFLIEDLKKTYLKEENGESIEVVSLKNRGFTSDEYIFVLGFNNGSFPVLSKDEDFFSDAIKQTIGFSTSIEKNKLEKEALINQLYSISNVTITYKRKTAFDEYHPSTLIQDFDMKEEPGILDFKVHYSKEYDALKLTSMLDQLRKYGKKSTLLEKYNTSMQIPYLTYDHTYQPIDTEELYEYLNHKLTLSYSKVNCYYHCNFQYYIQEILKLTKFEDTLAIKIGNIFHKILSEAFKDDFHFEEAYERECNALDLSKKERFYLQKLKKELSFIIETIEEQNRLIGFNNALFEEKIYIPLKEDFPVTFTGIVDKILWQEKNGKKLVSIIDYKTGSTNLDLRLLPHGLSLQLPTYMYLVQKSEQFKNSQICGIYLQKILNSPPKNSKDVAKDKKDTLKLQGYTIDDESLIEIWDSTYENSEVIKSLKKSKNGWYHYAKLLNQEEIERLINITEEKIHTATTSILNADFSINPKRVEGKNISCEFCHFKDICYQKEQDIVDLKIDNELSFLKN